MASRKCTVCGAENEAEAFYCRRCGAFLLKSSAGGKISQARKPIWQVLDERRKSGCVTVDAPSSPTPQQELWVRCPDCGQWEPAPGGRKPLQCSACNRFFQESDPVMEHRTPESEKPEPKRSSPEQVHTPPPANGPMRRGRRDQSSLRLIGQSMRHAFVLSVPAEGGILGSSGSLHPELFRSGVFRSVEKEHLMFWHTDAGWYLRALAGETLYNGLPLNLGASIPLANGDLIHAGDCPMRVEITHG